ncbi:MAG: hypothetical protein KKI09_01965, partial [Spirochaetes bacterium]|nr:hypothetical protein [Spirochaetota bacterium]
ISIKHSRLNTFKNYKYNFHIGKLFLHQWHISQNAYKISKNSSLTNPCSSLKLIKVPFTVADFSPIASNKPN